jgi:hypothetical protein
MPDSDYTGALAEFGVLRTEMDSRFRYQQQILALQLTLTSAVFTAGLSKPVPVGVLMIVPLSSYLLCGRYIGQRTAIRWVARYITTELSPRVPGGLGWVEWARTNRRPERLLDWYVPLLLSFPGAGMLALGWTIPVVVKTENRPVWGSIGIAAIWLTGVFATAVSTYLLTRVFRDRGAPQVSTP